MKVSEFAHSGAPSLHQAHSIYNLHFRRGGDCKEWHQRATSNMRHRFEPNLHIRSDRENAVAKVTLHCIFLAAVRRPLIGG